MEAALAYIRSKPFGASNLVRLTVSPENAAACHLYQTLRFSPTGRADGDEIELERVLDCLRPMRRPSASADCITVIILFPKTMLS